MGSSRRKSVIAHADPKADDAIVRATFESAPDGVVVVSDDGRVLAYNARFLELWNFPPDVLARRELAEMRRHSAAQVRESGAFLHSHDLMAGTEQAGVFDEVELLDGRVFERHVSPLEAPGVPGALVIRWRDVSAQRGTEYALKQTQHRLAALFEHALNAILMADDNGRYVDANPAACELLGYGRDELLGMLASQVIVPGTMDVDANWSGFLESGRSRGRVHLQRKDGRIVVAQFSAVANLRPGVHLSVLSDVTEEARALQQLEEQARTDGLTGISNRRHFIEVASDELVRAGRYGHGVALLMIDLDHFKAINDRYGHAGGDEVLRSFVRTARTVMRQSDLFARVGGEEFAALLPHTPLEGALVIAQRLLLLTREQPARVGKRLAAYSVSVGVAAVEAGHATGASIEGLLQAADRSLYRAKAQGRNRVVVAEGP